MNLKTKNPIFLQLESITPSSKSISDLQGILDIRHEVVSVTIGCDNQSIVYPGDTTAWLDHLRSLNTSDSIIIGHDIRSALRSLDLNFDFKPLFLGDTMLMCCYCGYPETDLELQAKRIDYVGASNRPNLIRLSQLNPADWKDLVAYNAWRIKAIKTLYFNLLKKFPERELQIIDQTLKLCLKKHNIDWVLYDKTLETLEANLKEETSRDVTTTTFRNREAMRAMRERAVDPRDNKALIDLNYSKAVTHRWTGGSNDNSASFNIQNIQNDSGIKELWIADPDCVYIIVDLNQIEARVLAWLADEHQLLQAFTEGRDIYCEFGNMLFGTTLNPEDSRRSICKIAILGLGYGMGAGTFLKIL
jgi:hypothetical protein